MTDRDPRIDPQVGDRIFLPRFAGGCWAEVKRRGSTEHATDSVGFTLSRIDHSRIENRGRRWSIATWQDTTKDATTEPPK